MLDIVHLGPQTFSRLDMPEVCMFCVNFSNWVEWGPSFWCWKASELFVAFSTGNRNYGIGFSIFLQEKIKWQETVHHGRWVSGVNAGGSGLTHLTTHKGPFWHEIWKWGKHAHAATMVTFMFCMCLLAIPDFYFKNPRYFITLTTPDANEVVDLGECTCIISLMLKDFRKRKYSPKHKRLIIGFDVHLVSAQTYQRPIVTGDQFLFVCSENRPCNCLLLRKVANKWSKWWNKCQQCDVCEFNCTKEQSMIPQRNSGLACSIQHDLENSFVLSGEPLQVVSCVLIFRSKGWIRKHWNPWTSFWRRPSWRNSSTREPCFARQAAGWVWILELTASFQTLWNPTRTEISCSESTPTPK